MELDPLHELIIDFIEETNRPIFLTGKAGTGKTTFLRYIRSNTKKNLAVVAPTAVAAINAGGVTIHSFFQVPFGPVIPMANASFYDFSQEKAKLIKSLDLLIIDEISMVRADTIDYIDKVLRFVKGNNSPFGGVQLLMIGDLYQLPPVFQNDWHLLGKFYKGPYFFDSLVFSEVPLLTFELIKVHRQSDPLFIEILNEIRNGSISEILLDKLNERYIDNLETKELPEHVTLTTHNPLVKKINIERLEQLKSEIHYFKAKITGEFPTEAFPTEDELVLKVGAMVMFIKNDSSGKKLFYNGRTAKVTSINGQTINLTFLDDGSTFEATPETWENNKYTLSETDQKITQTSSGSFTQFPLRLAWAITIHKSQGLSFDKAVIDVGAAFAHGQTYVALSRCRTLDGLILKERVNARHIITDPSVSSFMKKVQIQMMDQTTLEESKAEMQVGVLVATFDFAPINAGWKHLQEILVELLPTVQVLHDKIELIQQVLGTKISPIAARFIRQELQTTDQKFAFEAIKDRLAKAAGYFLPFLTELNQHILDLHQFLTGVPFHTDYFPTLNLLLEQLATKIEVFKLFPNIKQVADIVTATSNTVISYIPIDSWKQKQTKTEIKIENPALYAKLMDWRKQTAEVNKTLEYHIISDQAMADISAKLPRTMTQLSKIKNVGEGKTAAYGEQILKTIRQHFGENELFF